MRWLAVIGHLVFAWLVQVLLFNNLHFMGICFPYVYITALICMPVLPRWSELLIGALIGVLMDLSCSSAGMHTAACVLLMGLRPVLLEHLVQDYERLTSGVVAATIGISQFVRLAVILCLLHHAVVFAMDAWSISLIGMTALRWAVSVAFSLLVILGYGLLRKP